MITVSADVCQVNLKLHIDYEANVETQTRATARGMM